MVSCKIVLERKNHIFLHLDCSNEGQGWGGGGLNAGPDVGFYPTAASVDGEIGVGRMDGRSKRTAAVLTSF